MNSKTHISIHRDVAMVVFIAAVFILAVVYSVFSSTTIGDNINTGGTLTVSGASTLQHAYASSTVQATGNILGYANVGVGTTTPGTKLAVHGGSTLIGGEATIYGTLNLAYFQATSTTASFLSGNLGIGTTTPGTKLAVHGGSTFLGGETTIYGTLNIPYLQSTSTTASYFTGSLGIGSTTPGATLAVNGPGIFVGTSTIFGGLNLESLSATGTLGFYTRGTAAPRLVIDSSGNVGVATSGPGALLSVAGAGLFTATSTILSGGLITEGVTAPGILGFYTRGTAAPRLVIDSSGNLGVATSGPATTFSTVGSGYFTGGLGVGYATTGSGDLLTSGLVVLRGTGRLGFASTSPYNEIGFAGDLAVGGTLGTSTISLETDSASTGGCIELRGSDGKWLIMYPGSAATSSGQFGVVTAGGRGLVVEYGTKRCQAGSGAAGTD